MQRSNASRRRRKPRRLRSFRGLLLLALGLSALACGPDDCQGLDASQCDARHLLERVEARLAVASLHTLEASERRLEGAVSARCNLGLDGRFRDCAIVESLPELDGAVLAALAESEYEPATFPGRPTQIQYVFNFDFRSE